MYSKFIKRLLDITRASIGLILLSPVIFIIGILIWFTMGSPVIFSQMRPGLKGKPFRMFKFRTMTDAR